MRDYTQSLSMLTGLLRSITRSIIASLLVLSVWGGLDIITSIYTHDTQTNPSQNYQLSHNSLIDISFAAFGVCADGTDSCYIKDQQKDSTTTAKEANQAAGWVKGLNAFIAFISMLYVPLSIFGGWLLSPEWTYGDLIGIRPIFHHLWVFVSNFVYVAFAGVLVFVAIANIFGQSDSYAIKKMLPRFIVGVIMVPLTWFAVSATLSVTNYATAMVLRLPADTITSVGGGPASEFKVEYPTHCTFDFTGVGGNTEVWKCDEGKNESKKLSEILTNSSNGAYGILPYYAYNVFEFGDLTKFKDQVESAGAGGESVDGLSKGALIFTTLAKIGVQLTLKVVFFVVFMVILIMLVFVMMLRMIRMWFYIIFSPLFALRFFLADKVDKENVLAKFSFTEFLSLAMVPVFVAGALGFGFMFLMVFKQTVSTGKLDSEIVTDKKTPDGAAKTDGFYIFGVTEIEVKILSGKTKENKDATVNLAKDTLAQLLSSLMTPILGIIILWMAVLAAAKSSTITKEAVGGFESAGKMVGDVAKKVPGMITIPGSGAMSKALGGSGKGISVNQGLKIPDVLKEIHQKHLGDEADALRSSLGLKTAVAEFATDIRQAGTDLKKAMNITGNALGDARINEQYNNNRAQDGAIEFIKKQGIHTPTIESNFKSGDKTKYKSGWKESFEGLIRQGKILSNSDLYAAIQKYNKSGGDDDLQAVFKLMKAYGSKPEFKSASYSNGTIRFTDTAGIDTNAITLNSTEILDIKGLSDDTKRIEKLKQILGSNPSYSGHTSEASETQLKQIVQSITGTPTPPTP